MEIADVLIESSKLITAIGVIAGVVIAVIKWFQKQDKQTKDIEDLKQLHLSDMKNASEREAKELGAIKDELCVLSYAMLASLDGLKQQGCNGNVTKAYDMLEKHLNQRAHDQ